MCESHAHVSNGEFLQTENALWFQSCMESNEQTGLTSQIETDSWTEGRMTQDGAPGGWVEQKGKNAGAWTPVG